MIFRPRFLEGIWRGEITLAFRRWIRPSVRAGGSLRTALGVVRIGAVEKVDRSGRLTAVLGVLRGPSREPSELAATGAAPGARLGAFVSRAGPVGERVELRDGKKLVLTVHGFQAGSESYRFFVTSMGAADDPAAEEVLRTIGAALSLEDLAPFVRGRLHG